LWFRLPYPAKDLEPMVCGRKSCPTRFPQFPPHFRATILAAAALSFFAQPARSHDWYPHQCCSGGDCYAISTSEVEALPDGSWEVKATGEIFAGPNADATRKVKFSPDGQYHRCSFNHDRKATSICLFIPLPSGW
jgi:hypothetical protein